MNARDTVMVVLCILCADDDAQTAGEAASGMSLQDAAKLLLSAPRLEYPLKGAQKK